MSPKTASKLSGQSHMIASLLSPTVLSTRSSRLFCFVPPPRSTRESCNLSGAFKGRIYWKKYVKNASTVTSNIGALPKGFYSPQALFFCVSFAYVKVGRTLESRHIWHEVVQAIPPPTFPNSLSSLMPVLLTHTHERMHADAGVHKNTQTATRKAQELLITHASVALLAERGKHRLPKSQKAFRIFSPLDTASYFGMLFSFVSASRFSTSSLLPLSALPF